MWPQLTVTKEWQQSNGRRDGDGWGNSINGSCYGSRNCGVRQQAPLWLYTRSVILRLSCIYRDSSPNLEQRSIWWLGYGEGLTLCPKTIGKKTIIISYPVWRSATVQSCSSHYSYQQVHSGAMFKRRAYRLLPLKAWNTGNIYCKIRTSSLKKKQPTKTNIWPKFHGTMRFTIMGPSISVSTLLNCVIFDARPLFETQWFLRFSRRCLLGSVHRRRHTSAPPESNSQFSYSIPFSGWSSVSIVQDHVHPSPKHTHAHTNNGGHSTDCLLYSSERLATWLLLTFNRVHYGGRAPIQLLHNTGDILRVFLAPLWAFLCSFHPKPFTLCPPVILPKVAVSF